MPPGQRGPNGSQLNVSPVSRQGESLVEPPVDPLPQRLLDRDRQGLLPARVAHDHAVGLGCLVHNLPEGGQRIGQKRLARLGHQPADASQVPGPMKAARLPVQSDLPILLLFGRRSRPHQDRHRAHTRGVTGGERQLVRGASAAPIRRAPTRARAGPEPLHSHRRAQRSRARGVGLMLRSPVFRS